MQDCQENKDDVTWDCVNMFAAIDFLKFSIKVPSKWQQDVSHGDTVVLELNPEKFGSNKPNPIGFKQLNIKVLHNHFYKGHLFAFALHFVVNTNKATDIFHHCLYHLLTGLGSSVLLFWFNEY